MDSEHGFASAVLVFRRRMRRVFAGIFAPLVNWLVRRDVSPDEVTWAGFGLAFVAAILVGFGLFIAGGIVYLASGIADLLDGALARGARRPTPGGAFLDSTLDRAGEGLVHAGAAVAFAWWGLWPDVLAVVLSLTGSYLTSYTRARAEGLGIELEEAWVGRGERVVLLATGFIFHFALIAFWILAVLGWATAVQRGMLAHRRLSGIHPQPSEEWATEQQPPTREPAIGESSVQESNGRTP
ncbi:MAG: CDP-alcohol phosphatidyltransferase family protein [Gammaproteobacteria bacterium]